MSIAYLNGRFLPFRDVSLPVWDRGVAQGATVTERLRTFRHRPFLLEPHLDRLDRSLEATGMKLPESRDELVTIIEHIVAHESRRAKPDLDFAIVLFVTAGPTTSDARLQDVPDRRTLCVHVAPLPFSRWAREYREGQRLVIPPIRQIPADVIDPAIKNRSRLHWFLADQCADQLDPGASALLLDHAGRLTETSAANLFLVRDGELLTPGVETTLSGISQQYVRELADDLGIAYQVRDLFEADLASAQEVLLSSSSYCLMPVAQVDRRPIGQGVPGPVFERLIGEWSRRVGMDIRRQGS